MNPKDQFDSLYTQLASAWEAHQALRRSHAPLPRLAESSTRLYDARFAMADWHRCQQREET